MKNSRNNKMKASPPAKTIAMHSKIVPMFKTHVKNPYGQDKSPVRTRTYQHPNIRFKNTGTWKKV